MRFFTPELYCQFNSTDEEVADRANDAWEDAIRKYRRHLENLAHRMPPQVKKLSELSVHDAEVLGFDRDMPLSSATDESRWPNPSWSAMTTILSLKQDRTIHSLIYLLWDRVCEYPAVESWPFSKSRQHWLYDEIDVASDHLGIFLHRILFSDGTIVEIPFISALVNSVALPASDEGKTVDCSQTA